VANPYNAAQQSINRYWTITPTNPNTNTAVALTLTWLDSETNGMAFTSNQAQAWRREVTDTDWTPVDNIQTIVTSGNERSIYRKHQHILYLGHYRSVNYFTGKHAVFQW
jgi:hypothetical protein